MKKLIIKLFIIPLISNPAFIDMVCNHPDINLPNVSTEKRKQIITNIIEVFIKYL